MNLSDELQRKLIDIAVKSVPREMCGLLIYSAKTDEIVFKEVPNIHPKPMEFFRIDARVIAAVSIAGDSVLAYVHSHPHTSSSPSADDVADMNLHGKPFIIVSARDRQVSVWYPTTVPLVGRQYVHGKQDCYTIVQEFRCLISSAPIRGGRMPKARRCMLITSVPLDSFLSSRQTYVVTMPCCATGERRSTSTTRLFISDQTARSRVRKLRRA